MSAGGRLRRALIAAALLPMPAAFAAVAPAARDRAARDVYEWIRELSSTGRHAEAERAANEALERAERDGADPRVRASLLDLWVDVMRSAGRAGQAPEARPRAEEAVRLKEALYGGDHPEVAASLRLLGMVCRQSGDMAAALSAFRRALRIRERTLPPDDPQIARDLINVAVVESDADHAALALELYGRALAILERSQPLDHADRALILNNMGSALESTGDYERALARFQEARRICEKLGPSTRSCLASSLHDIGEVLNRLGDFTQAREYFERALALREEETPPNPIRLSEALGSLANLHAEMGDYTTARPLYDRALPLRIEALGAVHMFTATLRRTYGRFLHGSGDDAAARAQLEAALDSARNVPSDRLVAVIETDLADVLSASGEAASARALYRRSLDALEATGHPLAADALHGLANLLGDAGETEEAFALYDRALRIRAGSLGAGHPLWARALLDLARTRWTAGYTQAAFDEALRAEEVLRDHLRDTARALPEREALRYEIIRASGIGLALSVILDQARAPGADLVRRVWDQVARSRALVLDEMAGRHAAALEGQTPEIQALVQTLEESRRRRAWLRVSGPDPERPADYAARMEQASQRVEEAERDLARRSVAFRDVAARREPGLDEALASLPPEAALVAYVQYPAADRTRPRAPGRPRYAAFVLSGGGGAPQVVPIGPVAHVDELVRRWRREVSSAPTGRPAVERTALAGQDLRRLLWDPVSRRLAGARMVFVVPDGLVHLVPLSALPAAAERFLLETGPTVHYLSAERDLIARGRPRRVGRGLLAVGAPDFDAPPRASDSGSNSAKEGTVHPFRGSAPSCGSIRSMRFAALPGAAAEVEEVSMLWRSAGPGSALGDGVVTSLTGGAAQEATFKRVARGSRAIHLATHGFYGAGDCAARAGEPGPGLEGGASPLLLSGLALAGANRRGELKDPLLEEDGVLTAEEIASLDLRGVEWVVLSGCETGLGEVQAGEGVLGLRRAFEVAGAGALILTLWPVGDHDARDWVRRLYEARLSGASTAEALREASLRVIAERRRAGLQAHPFSWGAFVGTGDWR